MGKSVAFIIPRIGKGGAERVVVNIANQMADDGYSVKIFTILSGEVNYKLSEKVHHIHLNVESRNRFVRIVKRFFTLRRFIKRCDADTIIAFDRYYGILCSLYAGKKVIGSERNDPYSNMPRKSFQKYVRDYLYQRVDHVVFQTEYAQDYFSKEIQKHSSIIPNPVAAAVLPDPYTLARDHRIVTACRLTQQKNLPMMIDAFAAFNEIHPGYELVIYGEGHLLESLKEYAIEKGIGDRVFFPGYVNDLPEIMNSAAMYVSSSDYEGISNSMLEAMAIGLPVVCTDCPAGGAAMVIENGVNGFLIPVRQPEEMTKAMCRIVEEPERSRTMSGYAVKVRETYSIHNVAKQWENLLK